MGTHRVSQSSMYNLDMGAGGHAPCMRQCMERSMALRTALTHSQFLRLPDLPDGLDRRQQHDDTEDGANGRCHILDKRIVHIQGLRFLVRFGACSRPGASSSNRLGSGVDPTGLVGLNQEGRAGRICAYRSKPIDVALHSFCAGAKPVEMQVRSLLRALARLPVCSDLTLPSRICSYASKHTVSGVIMAPGEPSGRKAMLHGGG